MKRSIMFGLILPLFLLLVACGSESLDHGAGSGGGVAAAVKQGQFIDTTVEGLSYISGSQSGATDANGWFTYEEGAAVKFFIGDIVIGEAMGKSIITPVDLVQGAIDETDSTVTNIASFLQTLDVDADLSNGITITDYVSNLSYSLANNINIDFSKSIADFGNDLNVNVVVNALTAVTSAGLRPLVASSDAQDHLKSTLLEMLSNIYSGTFSGDSSGLWTIVVDTSGNIIGYGHSDSDDTDFTIAGTVNSSGKLTMIGGIATTDAPFSGAISFSGEVSGTWENPLSGDSGTFDGSIAFL